MRSRHGQPPTHRYRFLYTRSYNEIDTYVFTRYNRNLMRIAFPSNPLELHVSAYWEVNGHICSLLTSDLRGPSMTLCVGSDGPELILSLADDQKLLLSHLRSILHYTRRTLPGSYNPRCVVNASLGWRAFIHTMDALALVGSPWRTTPDMGAQPYAFKDTRASGFHLHSDTCSIRLLYQEYAPHSEEPIVNHHFCFTFDVPLITEACFKKNEEDP
jgi:hypothetical protein